MLLSYDYFSMTKHLSVEGVALLDGVDYFAFLRLIVGGECCYRFVNLSVEFITGI